MVQNTPHTTVIYPANVASLQRAWTYRTGDAIESSPMVVNGVVYISSTDHTLYALNADTGDRLWSFESSAGIQSSTAIAGGIVYVGSWDHNVYALDATTGAWIWSYTTGDRISPPQPLPVGSFTCE